MTHQKLSTSEAEKLVFLQDSYRCALLGNQSQKHTINIMIINVNLGLTKLEYVVQLYNFYIIEQGIARE